MSIPYSPFSSYVGLQLPDGQKPFDFLTSGKTHTAQIVNVDSKGSLVSATMMWKCNSIAFNGGGGGMTTEIISAIFTQNEYK
jgi:hypothetical protein